MNRSLVKIIESLIVIIIIIILISIIFFYLVPGQLAKYRDARRKLDLDHLRTALFDYYFDFNCFPTTIPDCHDLNSYSHLEYFPGYRCDPSNTNYVYQPQNIDCPSSFKIFTILENKNDLDIQKTNCVAGCGPDNKYNYSLSSGNIP